jgi:hypothetical protein
MLEAAGIVLLDPAHKLFALDDRLVVLAVGNLRDALWLISLPGVS